MSCEWSFYTEKQKGSVFVQLNYLHTGNCSCRVQIWGLDHPLSIKPDIGLSRVLGPKTEDTAQKMKAYHISLSCRLYMGGE